MNKKGSIGSVILIGLVAVCYFIFGMTLYQFLKTPIDIARSSMNCSAPTSWGDMGVCLIIGGTIPLVLITILSIAGGIVTERMLK